jgi:hypothetical protein
MRRENFKAFASHLSFQLVILCFTCKPLVGRVHCSGTNCLTVSPGHFDCQSPGSWTVQLCAESSSRKRRALQRTPLSALFFCAQPSSGELEEPGLSTSRDGTPV